MDLKEKKLSKLCAQKDRVACESLYNQYSQQMYKVCKRYANTKEDAQDMLQIGFSEVFKNISKWKGNGPLGAWIRKIILNQAIVYLRKNKKYSFTEEFQVNEHQVIFESHIVETLSAESLISLLDMLPDGYKTVFNMYVIDQFSHKEIAKFLDISVNTSKTQLRKARIKLQELICEQLNGEYEEKQYI